MCADNQAASVPTKGWSTPAPEEALRNTAWAGPFARVSRELEASQKVVADATHAGEAASRLVALLEGGAKPPLRDALLTRPASGFEAVLLRGALLTHKMLDGAVARHLGWKGVKVARSTQQPPPPAPPSPPDDGGPPPCPPSPGGDAPTPLPTPGAGGGGRVSGGVQLARAPA